MVNSCKGTARRLWVGGALFKDWGRNRDVRSLEGFLKNKIQQKTKIGSEGFLIFILKLSCIYITIL